MPFSVPQYISVVIIGGGQAGLFASYCLRQRGVDDHVIFEKARVGQSWLEEDGSSFVHSNHSFRLPGDMDGSEKLMTNEEVIGSIERYVRKFRPPVLEEAEVTSITKEDGYFRVTTGQGLWYCDDVIVATGGFSQPNFKFIDLPVFNMRGFPETERGVTSIPGLYFLGLRSMYSSDLAQGSGIVGDADHVASRIAVGVKNDLNPPVDRNSFSNDGHAISG